MSDTIVQKFNEVSTHDDDGNKVYILYLNGSKSARLPINCYLRTHDYWIIVVDELQISDIYNWLKHHDLERLHEHSIIFPGKNTLKLAKNNFTSYHSGNEVRDGRRILKVIIRIGQRSDFALPDLSGYDTLEIHVESNIPQSTIAITIEIIHPTH